MIMGRLKSLAGLVLFLAIWEAIAISAVLPSQFFPSVPRIGAAAVALVRSSDFLAALVSTWELILGGLVIAVLTGLALALISARYAVVRRALAPLVEMLRALPPPAIVPPAIFAFGLGAPLFLFIVGFAAVWPVYVSTSNALATAEPVQMLTGRSLGYSNWEILLRLRLPAALPEILTAVKLAAGIALLAVIGSEMLAGSSGLGYLLYNAAFTGRSADMFAIMFVVGVTGILLQVVLLQASKALVGWHMSLSAMGEAQ